MDKKGNGQGKKCFIITPIGDTNSDIFRKAKGVIDSVIKPVLQENGFDDIKPAYEINMLGTITTQIINRIIDDDLVIVNLTGNNPNVMYELCLRHVVAKPVIHICEQGTVLPFDIRDDKTIFYKDDMLGTKELKEEISLFLRLINYNTEQYDNPIYKSISINAISNRLRNDLDKSVEKELLRKLVGKLDVAVDRHSESVTLSVDEIERICNSYHVLKIYDRNFENKEETDRLLNNYGIEYVGKDKDDNYVYINQNCLSNNEVGEIFYRLNINGVLKLC